ncbi:MAG TPA: hypothetical protein VKM56_15175 [Verrucomicrobiae bacterium]|nr:hypothetical protein [Verrucomicrobiae bacterium]
MAPLWPSVPRLLLVPTAFLTAILLAGVPAHAATDDFNDGTDDGWIHYNPIGTGSWTLLDGTYRLRSSPSPSPSTYGPGRVGSLRAESYAQFYIAVDLVTWDNSLDQLFGVIARVGNAGLGSTRGYTFTYATRTGRSSPGLLQILRIDNESGTELSGASSNILLQASQSYRLVFTGVRDQFTGQLFALPNLTTAVATITGSDPAYASGGGGVFTYDNSSGGANRADTTFDNFVFQELAPPLTIAHDPFSADVRLSWPDWATDYRLQRATQLPADSWEDLLNFVDQANGSFYTFDDTSQPAAFYRLIKP